MTPLGFGSAGFFYRRHRPHRDRHISRSKARRFHQAHSR